MEFAYPNILYALAAVPALAVLLVYGEKKKRADLTRFAGENLRDMLAPWRSWRKNLLKGLLKTAGLALLIVAVAGPRSGNQLVKVEREGVDLVIALDTSLSMLAEDMLPNRLERAKQEMVDLIGGLEGDRVGIVVFAGDAVAVCPLTVDYDAALMFARAVDVDAVSEPGTAIDKAIEKSLALFDDSGKRDRAIIVITDGENHEGRPEEQAAEAGRRGVRIYTIGIGNPTGGPIPERGQDGAILGHKKNRKGDVVLTRLDEKTLQQVASTSGGKYLPATQEGLELKVLYNEISGMERKKIKGEFIERKKERFWMFLAGALGFLFLDAVISTKAVRGERRRKLLHTGAAAIALVSLSFAAGGAYARNVDAGKVKSGNMYFDAGEYDKAKTLYFESLGDTLKLPKNFHGVFYNQGNASFMQDKFEEAVGYYQKSYSEDSTLTERMLYNRGNALLHAGNVGAAVESYLQALDYSPNDEDVMYNLELALRLLEQQKQQQQQQDQKKDQGEESDEKRQQQDQGQDQEQNGQQQQEPQEEQKEEQQEEQEQRADSTQVQPLPPDSTEVQQAQLTEEDLQKLSLEDAIRILQALEEQEKKLQQEKRKAAFKRIKKLGKDW